MSKGRPPKTPDVAPAPRQRRRGADKTKSEAPTRTIRTLIREAPSRQEFDQIDISAQVLSDQAGDIGERPFVIFLFIGLILNYFD